MTGFGDSAANVYWARTGKPTIIVQTLHRSKEDLEKILNSACTADQLEGLDLSNLAPLPLLYQTGYLTIKSYDRETQLYRLGVPNREVRRDLFQALPYYVSGTRNGLDSVSGDIMTAIMQGEPEKMMSYIDAFLAGVPYEMKMDDENNFHNADYILLSLIGARTETEVRTSDGRIDIVVKSPRYIYIVELKYGKNARTAMDQIEEKEYARPYLTDSRRIYLIGANFNKRTRRIDPPVIREVAK